MGKINQLVILDVETGGLKPKENPITSIAYQAITWDTYQPILEYSTYIQPYAGLKLEQKALDYSNTTHEQIANGLDYKDVVKKMAEDFSKANTTGSHTSKLILVGHNPMFDAGFLCYIFKLAKYDITKYFDCAEDGFGNPVLKCIDTLHLSKMKWANDPEMPNYKLGTCVDKAGIPLFDAHNAMNDVRGTKELLIYLMNNMRTGNSNTEESKAVRFRNHFQF